MFEESHLGAVFSEPGAECEQDKSLPIVLGKEEVRHLYDMTRTPKHTMLLRVCYTGGQRVSEHVTLSCKK